MNYQSPLKDFCIVVQQVVDTAITDGAMKIISNNESATRTALIDPILRKLGWDVSEPVMVEVEKRVKKDNKNVLIADYILKNQNNLPMICVEAKKMGGNLKDYAPKLMDYSRAFKKSIKYAILTDGLIWQFYDCDQPVHIKSMVPDWEFDLSLNTSESMLAFSLFMLSKIDAAHYWVPEIQEDPLKKIAQLASDLDSLKKDIQSISKALGKADLAAFDSATSMQNALNFVDLKEIQKKFPDSGKPTHLRLPSGEVIEIKTWKAILLESCKYVLSTVKNVPIPFVDKAGKSTLLISDTKPFAKVSYIETSYQGRTVYIYLNYDAKNCIANALYIFDKYCPSEFKSAPAVVIA